MTSQPKVYVVDDSQEMRESLSWLLGAVGTEVETFPSANAFLEQVDPAEAACLILDIHMPGISGIELQRELKRLCSRIKIIFLTGQSNVPAKVRESADGFFEKASDEILLLEGVRKVIHQIQESVECN